MTPLIAALAKPEPPTLAADLLAHAPLGIVVLVALVLLMTDAFARTREAGFQRPLALLGLALAIVFAARELGSSELDVGRTVAFLASDGGSYITGQTINVDGGMVIVP